MTAAAANPHRAVQENPGMPVNWILGVMVAISLPAYIAYVGAGNRYSAMLFYLLLTSPILLWASAAIFLYHSFLLATLALISAVATGGLAGAAIRGIVPIMRSDPDSFRYAPIVAVLSIAASLVLICSARLGIRQGKGRRQQRLDRIAEVKRASKLEADRNEALARERIEEQAEKEHRQATIEEATYRLASKFADGNDSAGSASSAESEQLAALALCHNDARQKALEALAEQRERAEMAEAEVKRLNDELRRAKRDERSEQMAKMGERVITAVAGTAIVGGLHAGDQMRKADRNIRGTFG